MSQTTQNYLTLWIENLVFKSELEIKNDLESIPTLRKYLLLINYKSVIYRLFSHNSQIALFQANQLQNLLKICL